MKPDGLVAALGRLTDVSDKKDVASKGAVSALRGFRVRGHRIMRKNSSTVVVAGPAAAVVAREVRDKMGRGASRAVRESL